MLDDYMLCKVLNKIQKVILIEKIENTKILTDTDDKFPVDTTLRKYCDINDILYKR